MTAHSIKQAKLLKRLGIGKYGLSALLIIALAVCLRLLLTALGWPTTNSDEGVMGIMARHIAYNGEYPIYFYGQNYMGSLEAYLGALFFHLIGPSLFTLRLGVILLDALFLASLYLLTGLLYTKKMALCVLLLLGLGSSALFLRELYATGGSTQTLVCGTLAFALATWLALNYRRDLPRDRQWLRYAAYAGWGLVVGLGIWSDMVVMPFLMMSSVLLLFCWRDLRSWAPLCLLLGLLIGGIPLIVYNLHAAHGQNSLVTIIGLFHGSGAKSARTLPQLIRGVKGTLSMSLPTATGDPFCSLPAVEYPIDGSPRSRQCTILHSAWSAGYLLLWLLSFLLTLGALWKLRSRVRQTGSHEERREIVLHFARLCLLGGAAIALLAFAVSSAPQDAPHSHARYLVGLLIVTPALIWPVWRAAAKPRPQGRLLSPPILNRGVLLLIALLFVLGSLAIAGDLSSSQQANQQQAQLISGLERIGATRIYSDYWTCNRLIFVSQERIMCGVTNSNLAPTHNRYPAYYTIVHADPHAAYVYPYDIFRKASLLRQADRLGHGFRRFVLAGYIVYQPV